MPSPKDKKRNLPASQRIPPIARALVSDRAKETLDIVCCCYTEASVSCLLIACLAREVRAGGGYSGREGLHGPTR